MTKQEVLTIRTDGLAAAEVKERLRELAEPGYQAFQAKLLPGTENVLGVRTPKLRTLAKEILKGDWRTFLLENDREWYENDLLQALVIAGAKMETEERLTYIQKFLLRIENWAVCDLFCSSLKDADRYPEVYWELMKPYLDSKEPYEIRFAVVMLLSHFVSAEYLEAAFTAFDRIQCDHYYVRMGVAWAVSIYYVYFPEETEKYLNRCKLDEWTYNKSLQKIIESYRVSEETKARIRSMKRKKKNK